MQLFVKIKDLWAEDETAMTLEYSAVGFLWFALFFFEKGAEIFGGLTGDELGHDYMHDYHATLADRSALPHVVLPVLWKTYSPLSGRSGTPPAYDSCALSNHKRIKEV